MEEGTKNIEKMEWMDYHKQAFRCNRCSYCKYIPQLLINEERFSYSCPSISKYNFHAYSGGGKVILACGLMENRFEYTPEVMKIVYNCNMCGACDIACKSNNAGNIEPLNIMRELRIQCMKNGCIPDRHKKIVEDLKNYRNPYAENQEKRGDWAIGMDLKDLGNIDHANVLYYVGCTTSFRIPELARATAEVLQKAGVDFGILGKNEICCASTAEKIGNEQLWEEYALENIEYFNSLGISEIVTSCAGCYGMMKVHYEWLKKEMNFKVYHITEYIEKLIKEGKIKFSNKIPLKITYHDPCHLGRLAEPNMPWVGEEKKVMGQLIITDPPKKVNWGNTGVFDPPRNILKQIPGMELVEMERIREYAYCCGAGGGVKAAYPDLADFAGNERIHEAQSTNAEALVTSCPFCEINLGDTNQKMGNKLKIFDVVELINKAMGEKK